MAELAHRESARTTVRTALETVLRPYAQAVLSRDVGTGALLLAAIATTPRLAALTLLAVLAAQVAVRALGFGAIAQREGTYACAAMLTSLAVVSAIGEVSMAMGIACSLLAVVITGALQSWLSHRQLPALALPFVLSAWIALLAARVLPAVSGVALPAPSVGIVLPATLSAWLSVPASMLYLHGALAGLLVVAAILWHSRIAFLLAVLGAAGAVAARELFRPAVIWSDIDTMAAFNAMLTAMALGGVWFVPHVSSMALALVGAMLTSFVTWALMPLAMAMGVPVLSLPFALTTIVMLLAMRLRERDRWPTSTVPANHPEDALVAHLMRVRRFGDFAWLPFRLPFRGTWTVTQGHDGPHTHRGPWRYAFDFEVIAADGSKFEGSGTQLSDYRCYGLPVLAAGAGTVEHIVDGIADNAVGGVNARDNWGNTVVLAHGANLFSVYSHLKPGSVHVKVGDRVKVGGELGRCGNSGRSLVPHLHFQVQRGGALGSETVPADFGDVIAKATDASVDASATVSYRVIPREGDVLRPILRDEALARALEFPVGSEWEFFEPSTGRRERARVGIDLQSRRMLESDSAQLYLEPYDTGLVIIGFDGSRQSLLRTLTLALARVPFDLEPSLAWQDRVPRRLLTAWGGALLDLMSVVAPGWTDDEIRYTARRRERAVTIVGTTNRVHTTAVIALDGAPHTLELRAASPTASSTSPSASTRVIEFRLLSPTHNASLPENGS